MRNSMIGLVKEKLLRGADIALGLGAAAAKLGFTHAENVSCSFESGRLKKVGAKESFSYAVDVLLEGRKGSAAGNDLDALEEMIKRAIALANVGSAAHFSAYPPPGEFTPVKAHSERTLSLTREQMVGGGQVMVDRLKDYNADMDISAGARRSERESLLVTSGGVCHAFRSTRWSLGCSTQRTEGTDMVFAGYGRSYGDLNEFYDVDYIVERVLWQLRNAETITDAPTGRTKVYLPPEALPMFLYPFALGVNGRNVAKGDSPLRGRLGEQVLDPCLSVADNPHRDWVGGAEIDSDGVPTRKITIFEKGVLKNFLYDLDSAGLADAEPTGNNGCTPYAATIMPGTAPGEELLASVDDGIYVVSLLGFGQSNIINGDFSSNVGLGYRIKNGKIIGRVKNTMIAGNLYEICRENVVLSCDVDPISLMPHAVLDGITASTAQNL